MSDSIYKIIGLIGTSEVSWENAAKNAVETAGKSLDDLRIAEISKLDMRGGKREGSRLSRPGQFVLQIL